MSGVHKVIQEIEERASDDDDGDDDDRLVMKVILAKTIEDKLTLGIRQHKYIK